MHDFGGKTFRQEDGGQRPNMAASRLVMEEFFDAKHKILTNAGAKVTLMKVYVDNGRQILTLVRKGFRFNVDKKEFVWDMIAEEEDEMRKKLGEDRDSFLARNCLPAMKPSQ